MIKGILKKRPINMEHESRPTYPTESMSAGTKSATPV